MGKLDGRIALVTGAADGLGTAICEAFAEEGATVVATDINLEGARLVASRVGNDSIALLLDVCDQNAWQEALDQVMGHFGKLDILVNNAGGAGAGTIEDTDLDFYRNCMKLNVDSVFMGSQLAIGLMKEGQGNIINISSIHGIRAAAHAAAYTAAKGGVRMLTKAIALHCAQKGYRIRCNSIHPGYIKTTQMLKWVEEQPDPGEMMAQLVSQHPIGFLGDPADIGKAAVYLASDDARFITGTELVVDGGFCL